MNDAQNAIKAALEEILVVIRHHSVYYYRVMMILNVYTVKVKVFGE
nr:hypothetical protein [Salmonella sp.]